MSNFSKKQMITSLKDHKVQLLVNHFLTNKIDKMNPIFDLKQGFRYPVVDKIIEDSCRTDEFLKKLFESGILEKKIYDKIVYCPNCNSANISIHYTCPHCKSFNIKKSALIEHIKCGFIDTEDQFQKNDKLVCPKCNKELITADVDYNKAGVWCNCNECNKNFDIPVPVHFCRECKENFTFDDALYKDVYSYSLTPEASKEATVGWIMLGPIMDLLEENGFKIESPGFLNGKSGTRHMFDLIAVSAENDTTVIDLATSKDGFVSEQSVISMFAKVFDSNPERSCLVAIPKMSENGKNLARLYKIKLIEALDQKAAIDALKNCIT